MLMAEDFDARMEWANDVSAGGNPVLAVERLAQLVTHSTLLQRLLAISVPGVVRASGRGLLPGELAAIRERLAPIGATGLWDHALAEIALGPQELEGVGLVFALTARRDNTGQTFGAVHPLQITGALGEPHRTISEGGVGTTDDARAAYEAGIQAALGYLHQHGAGSLDASTVIRAFGFSAHLPVAAFQAGLSGPSMGLATGLAVLSALLRCPLRRPFAITGRLSRTSGNDSILGIGEFAEKLSAARRAGLAVMCPAENVTGQAPGDDVCPVTDFAGAVSVAFGDLAIEERLAELSVWRLSVQARRRFLSSDDADEETLVGGLMISVVGGQDPFSDPDRTIDGPILTLCRRFRPRRALLLHTAGGYADRAAAAQAELAGFNCKADLQPLSIENPTDFAGVFVEFRHFVQNFLDTVGDTSRTPILLNVTSGSPQMMMALHLLVERGLLPDFRFQTVEPKFATDGKRFTRVRLPYM